MAVKKHSAYEIRRVRQRDLNYTFKYIAKLEKAILDLPCYTVIVERCGGRHENSNIIPCDEKHPCPACKIAELTLTQPRLK